MKNIFCVIIIAILGSSLHAQLENIPLITVTGQSAVKVKPDYVILGLKISKQIKSDSQNNHFGFKIFEDDDTKIRLFDFDENDIFETVIQNSGSKYIKEVFITIRDLSKLDKYMLELHKLGYTNYIYKDYRISDYERYKDQTRKEAINIARKKAEQLAKELGQTIGKAHTIEEIITENYNWYTIYDKNDLENINYKLGADEYIFEPGYIIINSRLRVSFDLLK